MDNIVIRHSEPDNAQAIKKIYECENVYSGTLQLPYPSSKIWQSRVGNVPDNAVSLVATMDDKIIGNLGFEICKNPRRRHVGSFGMGVSEECQNKGVGTALVSAILDLADNWLNMSTFTIWHESKINKVDILLETKLPRLEKDCNDK